MSRKLNAIIKTVQLSAKQWKKAKERVSQQNDIFHFYFRLGSVRVRAHSHQYLFP